MVKVYSKAGCMQCRAVKKWLDTHQLDYELIDTTNNEKIIEELRQQNVQHLPYIVSNETKFMGFNVPELNKLV